MKRIRLGKICYLNVLPIYHPLEHQIIPNNFKIVPGIPAELNQKMHRGELDISGTSSIEYARHWRDYLLIPRIAIGSNGPVKSVLFLSNFPLKEMHNKKVLLTSHSHTSAALLRLIFKREDIKVRFETGPISPHLPQKGGPDGVLAIGDEALALRKNNPFKYTMDLGEEWRRWTSLPFVFGVWVVNKKSLQEGQDHIKRSCALLIQAREWGCSKIEMFAKKASERFFLGYTHILHYFKGLVYDMGERELKGLSTFYQMLYEASLIKEIPPLTLLEV